MKKMRKFFVAVAAVFATTLAMAQTGFNYQAVIRNAQGDLVANQQIALRISLQNGDNVLYTEEQTVTTNAYGVASVVVGSGNAKVGSFASIDWGNGNISMKTEFDPNGGDNFVTIGTTQLQSVPTAEYAKTSSAVKNPKDIQIQATSTTGDDEALFSVKDEEGNVVFAVYKSGVRVYVDDTDNGAKAKKSGFAVAGRSAKDGEGTPYFAVNTDGTQVYVDDDDTKAAKSKFAVAGRAAKGDNANYFAIDGNGTRVYVDDDDTKAAKSKFAVAGRAAKGDNANFFAIDGNGTRVYVDDDDTKAAKSKFAVAGRAAKGDNANFFAVDGNGTQVFVDDDDTKAAKSKFAVAGRAAKGDNYLVVNGEGTKVFVDDTASGKAAKSKFAVAGKSAKGDDNYFIVNEAGTQVFIDDDGSKAAKSKFAVAGRSAKAGENNYLLINTDSTRVYIDDDEGKAAKSGFAVAGRSANKSGNSDILKVTKDSTRVYVDGGSGKSGFGVEGKGGSGKSGFAISEKGANGNAGYMNVTGANFFAGYNAGKSINLHFDLGGELPDEFSSISSDPELDDWFSTNMLLGSNNTFIGNNAGYSNDNGMNNVFMGVNAGYSIKGYQNYNNVFLGANAGKYIKHMVTSVAIGNNAGRGSADYDGEEWVSSDVFVGNNAGFSNTSGSDNVFIGNNAGKANTTGGSNVYIGAGAGRNNTESWSNTLINNTGGQGTGNDNIIIGGVSVGTDLSFGNGNIIIGLNALWTHYYEKDASGRLVIGTWITGKGEQVKIEKSLFVNGSMTLYGHLKSNTNGINDIGSSDWRFKTLYAKGINLYRADGKYTGNVAGSLIPEEEDQNLGGISPNNPNYTYRWNAIYGKTLDLSDGATIEGGLTVSSGGATIKGKLTVSGTSGAYIGGGVYPSGNYYNNLGKTDNRWNYVYGNYFYGTQSVEAPYVRATKQLTANSSASDMPNKGLEVSRTTPATNSDYYSSYYGGYFYMNGDHTGNVYGIYTYAMGKGTNYGIYSKAGYGTTNWAGYFDGDVKAGTVIPLANTSYDLGSDTYRWRTIYGHSMNINTDQYDYPVFVKSTKVSSESYNAAIYGESTSGKNRNIGVDARATSTQTGVHNHAVNGEASGGSYAVGIYGYAKNATYNYAGYFDGLVYINGSTYGSSDFRLKKDVQTISGALDKVLKLRGVSYYWKNREEMAAVKGVSADSMKYGFDSKKHIGVIAQEIEQEFPELINTDADGFKSVSYEGIAPILIEAVKELKAEKDELQTTVANQQQQIDELKRLVEELMKKQ